MRGNRSRRGRGGTLPLILVLLIGLASGSGRMQAPGVKDDPLTLINRAEKASDPAVRKSLAERALARLTAVEAKPGLRGRALLICGREMAALSYFQTAFKAGMRDGATRNALYQCCLNLDRAGKTTASLTGFKTLNAAFPRQAWTHFCLATVLRHLCRYGESTRVLRDGFTAFPNQPAFLNDCGLTWKAAGKPNKARECFQKALAKGNRDARLNLGWLLLRRGDGEEAMKLLRPGPTKPEPGTLASLLWLRNSLCKGKRGL